MRARRVLDLGVPALGTGISPGAGLVIEIVSEDHAREIESAFTELGGGNLKIFAASIVDLRGEAVPPRG